MCARRLGGRGWTGVGGSVYWLEERSGVLGQPYMSEWVLLLLQIVNMLIYRFYPDV